MCVIIQCEERIDPEILEMAERRNQDGAGIAWFEDGMVRFEKGLGLEDVTALAEEVPLPFVVHFRLCTAGGVVPELCHPFPVTSKVPSNLSGRAKKVMFHNGTITNWSDHLRDFIIRNGVKEIPDGVWSDSRAAAYMVSHIGKDGPNFLPILSKSDRFLVMDASDERYPIKRFGSWWYELDAPEDAPYAHRSGGKFYDKRFIFSNTYWKNERKTTVKHNNWQHG